MEKRTWQHLARCLHDGGNPAQLTELAVEEATLPLFERFSDPRTADFARRHRDVIARFGRFFHRNTLLGRVSSAAELALPQTPGSRF